MKRALFFLILFAFFSFPKPLFAAENWTINSFDSVLTLETNGKLQVSETIQVDFGSESKHGIFRKVPISYQGPRYIEVNFQSIKQDGDNAVYSISSESGYAVAKIGSPSKTISGKHTYLINYEATGVLNSFSDHDELYWNVLGDQWPVNSEKTTVHVNLPLSSMLKATCFEGPYGSTEACNQVQNLMRPSTQTSDEIVYSSKKTLDPGSDLSIVVSLKKDTVPILTVSAPKTNTTSFSFPNLFSVWSLLLSGLILLAGLFFIFRLWLKSGRDQWWKRRYLDDPNTQASTEPLGGHDTIVVEFSPPEKLRPAEIGTLLDERADTLDVTATIVDLANRGYLKITEIPKKWLFGTVDYKLEKTKLPGAELLDYESYLLEQLVPGAVGSTNNISTLKTTFYQELATVKTKLYQDLTNKKYFSGNPQTIRGKYLAIGSGVGVLGVFGAIGAIIFSPLFFLAAVVLTILGIILAIVGYFMPSRTAEGHELYRRARGFQLFISTAEKYRQQFFEKENLFNEFLAYAIVFGVTEKFAKAFADMGLKPPQPSWYVGNAPFNAIYFGSAIGSFSSSMSNAIAATPASSGSSGFGGGGFSGGGFGGGGGGSW